MIEMCFVIFVLWLWATIIVGFSIGLIHLPKIFAGIAIIFHVINFSFNIFGLIFYIFYEIKKFNQYSKNFCYKIIKILIGVIFLCFITAVGIYYGTEITFKKGDATCKLKNSTTSERTTSTMNGECFDETSQRVLIG